MPDSEESFLHHLPALLGSATATLIVTFGLSDLGYAGTLAGAAGGAVLIGGGSWWMERAYRKFATRARLLAAGRRQLGRPLTPEETQNIAAVVEFHHRRRNRGIPWRLAGLSAATVLVIVAAVIAVIEVSAGKPVSAIVQNQPASGLLVPVTSPSPTESFTPSPSPSLTPSSSPTTALSPSLSPSASPSVAQTTPAPSTSPAASSAPPSPSPAAS